MPRAVVFARALSGRPALALLVASLALPLLAPASADAARRDRVVLAAVQRHLGIYSVVGDQRDPTEQVKLQQKGVEIWFMRPVEPTQRDRAVCEGTRWLLTGRLEASAGAKALFDERRELDRITLVFFDLDTAVTRNRSGRYDQKRTPTPHARFTITRARAAQLDPAALSQTLTGTRCSTVAQSVLDELWTRD